MQSSSTMPWLSFRKNPRDGQEEVFKSLGTRTSLNIQLPTGYGKTYTACGCYSILKQQGIVNRALFVFPTDAQHEQFIKDGHADLTDTNVDGPLNVVDVRFFGTQAIKKNIKNEAQIFATTVQSLSGRNGMDVIKDLLEKGRWMIVVDEYHHYGIDKVWGKAIHALSYDFLMAMSATPTRKEDDSAFGTPDVIVSYRTAVKEKAVKPLHAHSYNYRIDAIGKDGDVHSFTTDDLVFEAGGESPDGIEKMLITRQMRWSGKYVSPLVSIPIERMLVNRLKTGYKLQAIVGAMCVSHAELVCDQIRSLFPELSVEWVGTGDNGRSDNKAILYKFCPPKDESGNRTPTLDILVHVGMAGEGLDSINVSEVVHLNRASKNNSNDQENGRASRYLPNVTGNINFDSSSEYASKGFVGEKIMDAMDGSEPSPGEEQDEVDEREIGEIPEEPTIQVFDMQLESINSGDIETQRLATVLEELQVDNIKYKSLEDKDSPEWDKVIKLMHEKRKRDAEVHDEKSIVLQWKESVNNALSAVTGRAVRMLSADGARFEKSLAGDLKKRINREKMKACGAAKPDVNTYKKHYQWIKSLEQNLIKNGVPLWLS